MYTQCPECLTAFRVTPSLLQQASGRVRCGSCSHAFNALEHLSEEPPPNEEAAAGTSGDDQEQDPLLDTFTDLSGFDDIRIEDTGVEWRVVDDDEPDSVDDPIESESTGSTRWFMTGEEGEAPAGEDALPEVRDEVPPDDPPVNGGADSGILVEEAGLHEPGPPEERQVELRYDDNTPLPDDVQETARRAEPEAPQRRATDQLEARSPEFDERQSDLELGAAEDWRELLDEFGREAEGPPPPPERPPEKSTPVATTDVPAYTPADIDTQFDLQAVEMGIDVTGSRRVLSDDAGTAGRDEAAAEEAVELELEADTDVPADHVDFDPGATASQGIDFDLPAREEAPPGAVDFNTGESGEEGEAQEPDFGLAEAFQATDEDEREQREREAALEAELDAAFAADEMPLPEPEVPPQTEEEMTINMQIDQDLMRLAAEDGFSATLTGERRMPEDLLVETIVMEGDFVKSAVDKELDAVAGTVGADEDPRLLLDTYLRSKEEHIRGGRRRTDPPSYTVIAGVAVLGLVLVAQVVHAYRESLATYGAFDQTVGSVYRLLGEPLVPEWDVRGWRFEATSGSTDAADEVLTIRSRISNQSGGELPYPLLHVALTDRFEEVIGSRVLQPADYLAEGEETEQTVPAGEEFSATVTVESVSDEATGFKLNVCYREDAARLRCATEDFRK